jgi:O-antigen ligase
MRSLDVTLPRQHLGLIAVTACSSVLMGYCFYAGRLDVIIGVAGVVLFAVLLRDIRLIVPIVIIAGPLGPKFAMSFGNLYLTTALVLVAYAAWIWRRSLAAGTFALPRNRVVVATAVLLAFVVISSIQSITFLIGDKARFLRLIQFFLYAGLFFMVLGMSFDRKQIRMLLVLVVLVGVIEGMIGAYQWWKSPGLYVVGTFDYRHSNYAVYVVYITLLLLGVFLESGRRWISVTVFAALSVLVGSILLSFSRGGYLSLGSGIGLSFLMPHPRARKYALLVVLAAAVICVLVVIPSDVLFRMRTIYLNLSGEYTGISFGTRLRLWQEALMDFTRNPILGTGWATGGLRDSFIMKILGEGGIVGTAAFAWFLATVLREQWSIIKRRFADDFIRGIAMGLLPATVACLIVFNISNDFFLLHRFMGTFWIVLALLLQYVYADDRFEIAERR